jgi:hypothetical protein
MWWSQVVSVLGPLVAAIVALAWWRVQALGKRRSEIAEEALVGFALALDAVREIRGPATYDFEARAVEAEVDPHPAIKQGGMPSAVTLWRMRQHADKFDSLRKLQLQCLYHFGEAASEPFRQLQNALHEVALHARLALDTPRDDWPEFFKIKRDLKWDEKVWLVDGQTDAIESALAGARNRLEAVLQPALRADASFWPRERFRADAGRAKPARDKGR